MIQARNIDSSKQTGDVSRYRWVVLLSIVPMIISTEMMWLTLAPVSKMAQTFYGVDSLSIDLLSISYMVMFILFSIPASLVVDKYGYRYALIIGALLTAVFGVVRAAFADQYTIVLVSQFIIAVGQPFLLNISTKVPANWFPIHERATATGILTMAQYIGFAVPMLLSPMLAEAMGIPFVMWIFAGVAVLSAVVCIALTKERPKVAPPGPILPRESLSFASLKRLFTNPAYISVLIICFISIGIFNTVLTLLETILTPHGVTSAQAGVIGAVFVVSGIIGAVLIPIISDKVRIRTPFFLVSTVILLVVYLGFTYVNSPTILTIMASVAGFSIMGVAPILFQHGSEVAYPLQEGTSLGLILMMGQISGILFIYLFEVIKAASGDVVLPMLLLVGLTLLELPILIKMKESGLAK